jgi:hypothetical protein
MSVLWGPDYGAGLSGWETVRWLGYYGAVLLSAFTASGHTRNSDVFGVSLTCCSCDVC